MIYISLGSQPVVSSVLKDCSLNSNSNIFDNVGELSFETLAKCLNNQFKDFFPIESDLRIYGGTANVINGTPYTLIKDKRNGTIFYDALPLGQKLSNVYGGVKARYEKMALNFIDTIKKERTVVFVRQMFDENSADTIELSNTLKYIFPACKFYLKHEYAGLQEAKCYDYWKQELCRGK